MTSNNIEITGEEFHPPLIDESQIPPIPPIASAPVLVELTPEGFATFQAMAIDELQEENAALQKELTSSRLEVESLRKDNKTLWWLAEQACNCRTAQKKYPGTICRYCSEIQALKGETNAR